MTLTHRAGRALRRGLLHVLLGLCGLAAVPVQALDRDLLLSQFHHSSWTSKDGAPLSTWQIEQTADGWLWLGGLRGLYRFDGVQFERFEPSGGRPFPSASVSFLRAAANGDLWVGLLGGGISRVRGTEVTHFGSADGLPTSGIWGIMVDLDGIVWAMSRTELLRFDGTKWSRIDISWGLNPVGMSIVSVLVDAQGSLWFGEDRGLWVLRRGERRFERVQASVAGHSWQTIDGRLWLIDGGRMSPAPQVSAAAAASTSSWTGRRHSSTLVDRQHNLWSAFCETGICRSRLPQPLPGFAIDLPAVEERFDRRDGLSGDFASHFIEDRTGSLWVSTQTGVDRFRRSHLVPVATPDGFAICLLPEPDGSVTVLGAGSATYKAPRRWRVDRRADPLPAYRLAEAVQRDGQGRVWLASGSGLSRSGQADSLRPWPDAVARQANFSMASDATGLWIAVPDTPLLRFDFGSDRFISVEEAELQKDRPRLVAVDRDGRTWFGFGDNRLLTRRDGRFQTYSVAEGLDIGSVNAVYAGPRFIVAGERGVALFDGGRFHRIMIDDPEALSAVSGIVETPDGQVWFNGLKGVVRIAASELDQQAGQPKRPLRARLFDALDGHSGSVRRGNANAALGADGRLWFITAPGNVVWLDPRRVDEPVPAPLPAVRSLQIADTVYRPGQLVELPELTQSVNLRYTALGAAVPERVRFRYRLEGLETGWTDAGARREVSYANLGPGRYVFQVLAGQSDGDWAASPATLAFTIRPAFFQTASFKALCAALAAALLWLLLRLRGRQIEWRARQQVQVRLDERESIARDLHDTLLQGVTGLTLHVRAAVNQVPPDSPARAQLEHALIRANEVMVEGRDRVSALRNMKLDADELAARLRCIADELAQDWRGPTHAVVVDGAARKLHGQVADEIYWIAREALVNAFQHARASHIALNLSYSGHGLSLTVRDDGVGFEIDTAQRGGHFGLAGLRERAARIDAVFDIQSRGSGTVVTVHVPAAGAYADTTPSG